MGVISGIIRSGRAIVHVLTQVSAYDVATLGGGIALGAGLWMYEPWVALVVFGAVVMPLGLSARLRRWLGS